MKHLYYLEVDNSAVLKETLKYYPGKQPAEIFSRETINGITHIRLGSKVKLNVAEQEKLQVNTLSNMSVVSAYATANFMFPELERVYNYFLKQWLPILLPQTDLKTWTTGEMEAEKENKSFLLDLLHRADFNISGFDVQQNEKNKKDTDLIFEHTIVANGTSSVHYLPDILESAGTMRYYGLGTILNILLERNAIIPVDELENSLHPDLFAHFINLFLVNSTYSQLIFSTHNLQSLDTEDLRKDVVWFTEKRMMVQQTCFHLMTSISAMAFRFSMHIMQGNLAPNQRWAVFLFLKNDKYGTRKKNKRNSEILCDYR
ncbi:ATP-binding protein [Bacteroides xylanisolvens]|nr:ATP-binding protein [Bacteroides xylanisolvens]MCS2981606.1 ATP-binding protein [Bacteroides xylanisolvens]MCS3023117.1 ATP-binding protein [Bacteroides xylanisolvens]